MTTFKYKLLGEMPLAFFHSALPYRISPMVLFKAEYKKKYQKCSIKVIYTNAWKTGLGRIELV